MGDVAEFIRGITYKPADVLQRTDLDALPCMRTKNVQATLEDDDLVFIPRRLAKPDRLLREGDILVSSANSWNLVGKCSWVPSLGYDATFGGFTSVLRADRKLLDPRYLYHWFAWDKTQATVRGLGQQTTNISNLNQNRCLDLRLELPPLDEQRRIAAILDKADALRQKRKRSIALLDTLTQSILAQVMDQSTNMRPLGELTVEIYRYPTYYGIDYVEAGVPEIRGELILEDGTIQSDPSTLRYISAATSRKFPKTVLDEGDLVMSVRGTIGKVGRVPAHLVGANITANLIRLAPDRDQVSDVFLWEAMRSSWVKTALAKASSSTTIATVKSDDLKSLPIPLPSLAAQATYAVLRLGVEAHRTRARSALATCEALFSSLQHRAFSGQL